MLVAWAKTISPAEARRPPGACPRVGVRDAFDQRLWEDGPVGENPPFVLEMWGRFNYSLAVVIAEGCAIDKEYNTLRQRYEETGLSASEAREHAPREADGFVTIAEVWPATSFPPHLQADTGSGATGYVPCLLPDWLKDTQPYAVDLNRIATVSWRALDRRVAMAVDDPAWRQRLQTGLCRHFASRSIRISAELQEIFQDSILDVEAVGVPTGDPPRIRVRIHFEGGRSQDLEAIGGMAPTGDGVDDGGAGLQTRRED